MIREGVDIFDEYGIEDKEPKAKFTNGPVRIGMGTADQPIGISDELPLNPRLGITLDSNTGWDGMIKQVEELVVMVPDSMSLDTVLCPEFAEVTEEEFKGGCIDNYRTYRSKQLLECVERAGLDREENIGPDGQLTGIESEGKEEEVDECMSSYCDQELEGYRAYKLKIDDTNKHLYANIGQDADEKRYKTFSCRVSLDKPEEILGNVPIATRYFRAKARYTYSIEEQISVNIEETPYERPDEERPDPPSYKDTANILSYIYQQFYFKEPYSLRKYCADDASSQFLGGEKECTCLLASVMAQESSARVDIEDSDKGAKGLMQILPESARDIWSKFELDSCNLYSSDCAIMTAAYYLKNVENSDLTGGDVRHYAAAYHGGVGAIKMSEDCPAVRIWECLKNSGYRFTRTDYVPDVTSRYEACMQMDPLEMERVVETEEAEFEEGKIDYTIIEGQKHTDENATKEMGSYNLAFYDAGEPTLYINYGTTRISNPLELEPGKEIYDPRYPLVRFTVAEEGDQLSYKYLKTFISEKLKLEEDKMAFVSGTDDKIKDYTTVIDGWIYAWYDGDELELYSKDKERPFCMIPWDSYSDRNAGRCEQGAFFSLSAVEDLTTESYTVVQFQYDIEKEHECCQDCKTCNGYSDLELFCQSCESCKLGSYGGSAICEDTQATQS